MTAKKPPGWRLIKEEKRIKRWDMCYYDDEKEWSPTTYWRVYWNPDELVLMIRKV